MSNYEVVFEASYDRVIGKGVGINPKGTTFFQHFYDNFFSKSDEIKKKFENTDMDKQVGILQKSIFHFVSFYVSKEENEYLHNIAVSHNCENYDIKGQYYDLWLDALVETVQQLDPEYAREVELAWRMAMMPGILYMRSLYEAET